MEAASHDDAAVFLLSSDRALVATTDFFTPIVDDAGAWGRIACANALSDIYAMGGTPLFALNLVAWPRDTVPLEILGEVLEGAADVARDAGCLLLGGHSVDDPEPKFGLAVVGEVHPDHMMTTAGARAGQELVLTKPLGSGIMTTARKRDEIAEEALVQTIAVMQSLNRDAAAVAVRHGVKAATDVTGFGLLGHLNNMLVASGLAAEIDFDALPVLDGTLSLAERGVVPGGTRRNLDHASRVRWENIPEAGRLVCADAQTSGGLLLAVAPEHLDLVQADLAAAGTHAQAHIGRLVEGPSGDVLVRRGNRPSE